GAVAGGRGVAADGAGPDPDPVRAGAAAGMAGRPAGGPGGAQRALAHVRREPGVRAHDPAAGAGAADPGAPDRAPDGDLDGQPAGLPRMDRGHGGAVDRGAHRLRAFGMGGPAAADRTG